MSEGKTLFEEVCKARDLAASVKALTPWEWQKLYGYLLKNYSENGVSGQVLGMMMVEATRRYAVTTRAVHKAAFDFTD
jgi:hypothetical protein